MDKYEYKLKLDELKRLVKEKKYEEASELADSINWRKVKNINSLVLVGEVYTQVARYEEARDILLEAYDRSPIGRMIIYRLAEIAIKTKDFEEASEYYNEFVDIAPHDNMKYILRYEMLCAKGAPLEEKIHLLEELKEQEYSEKWAFELAYLYHKAGESEKCIDACDELVLWFGDGPYVEKALELKMLYQPLNKIQEQKYRDFRTKKNGYVEVMPGEELESGEIVSEPVQIPDVTMKSNKFNTVNLQQELAKSMQQIMDATEKETVSDTMENIKKMVEDIPYLQIAKEEEEPPEERYGHIETDEEIDESINSNFQEYLAEDIDGQMSLLVPENKAGVPQITGQLCIDEILEEWERTKRAAEAAMAEAEQRKLESAKARALQEAEDIMERLSDVIPQLNAGLTPRDLLEKEYLSKSDEQAAGEMVANANDLLQREIDRISADLQKDTEPEMQIPEAEPEVESEDIKQPEDVKEAPVQEVTQETEEPSADEKEQILSQATKRMPNLHIPEKYEAAKKWTPHVLDASEPLKEPTPPAEPVVTPFVPPVVTREQSLETKQEETPQSDAQAEVAAALAQAVSEIENEKNNDSAAEPAAPRKMETAPKKLSEDQRENFTYFTGVKGMEEQLAGVIFHVGERLKTTPGASWGNIIIQSGSGNGKTTLAMDLVKALVHEYEKPAGKLGKIDASALNQKNVENLISKLSGGVLMIGDAGSLSDKTATALSEAMSKDKSGLLVIMEGTKESLAGILAKHEDLADKFTERIVIPAFSSDELVHFARVYANEMSYDIDEMAVLALYNRISEIQRLDEDTALTEVKEIVDEAIANAEKVSLFNLFGSKRGSDNGYTLLKEKDFES